MYTNKSSIHHSSIDGTNDRGVYADNENENNEKNQNRHQQSR
jgi:hypothetical protein